VDYSHKTSYMIVTKNHARTRQEFPLCNRQTDTFLGSINKHLDPNA